MSLTEFFEMQEPIGTQIVWFKSNIGWRRGRVPLYKSQEILLAEMIFSTEETSASFPFYFPAEVRRIIYAYLMDIIHYSSTPLPWGTLYEIKNHMHEDGKSVFVHDLTDMYFPLCRGYCFRCGEPARKFPNKPFIDAVKRRTLLKTHLAIMRFCYACCCIGYNFIDSEKRLLFPPIIFTNENKSSR